jgi:hypothetical protein
VVDPDQLHSWLQFDTVGQEERRLVPSGCRRGLDD